MMFMSVKEYAAYAGVSYGKVSQMCRDGEIPVLKFGARYRIDPAKVDAALQQKAQEVKKQPVASSRVYTAKPQARGKVDFLTALKKMQAASVAGI